MQSNLQIVHSLRLASIVAITVLCSWCTVLSTRAGDQIPFKGYIVVTGEPVGEPEGPFLTVHFTGPGRSTLLGNISVDATGVLNLVTLEYVGSAVWTASNGDLFFGDFEGIFVPIGPDTFENHETFTITGGTGRIDGATGGGVAGGVGNPFAPEFLIPVDATISSPGSNRH
jgi:hypothetical protein